MRYVPPFIISTHSANTAIQSRKAAQVRELDHIQLTAGPAYQSDE